VQASRTAVTESLRTVEEWWRYLACELEPDGSVGMSVEDGRFRVTPLLITRGARRDTAGRLIELQRGDEGRLAVFLSAVARRDAAALAELRAARPLVN
jgi:hypothetical protein